MARSKESAPHSDSKLSFPELLKKSPHMKSWSSEAKSLGLTGPVVIETYKSKSQADEPTNPGAELHQRILAARDGKFRAQVEGDLEEYRRACEESAQARAEIADLGERQADLQRWSEAGVEERRIDEATRARWKREAANLLAVDPHLSNSEIARRIAAPGEKERTIRREVATVRRSLNRKIA